MNTEEMNAPAMVIAVLILVAALLIGDCWATAPGLIARLLPAGSRAAVGGAHTAFAIGGQAVGEGRRTAIRQAARRPGSGTVPHRSVR